MVLGMVLVVLAVKGSAAIFVPGEGYRVDATITAVKVTPGKMSVTTGAGSTRRTVQRDCFSNRLQLRFVADGREQHASLMGQDGCHPTRAGAVERGERYRPGGKVSVLYEAGGDGVRWPTRRVDILPLLMFLSLGLGLLVMGGAELYASRAPTRDERRSRLLRVGCGGAVIGLLTPYVVGAAGFVIMLVVAALS